MSTIFSRITVLVISVLIFAISAYAELLPGTPGSAAGELWQSSWLNINPPTNFKKGETIKIKIGGNAENVLVRFLAKGSIPNSSKGIEGKVRKVSSNKTLELKLERNHPNVKQISVHAGKEAWGMPLGGNNGNVKIISIERSFQ
jgi:hypothetical protein